MSKRFQSNFEPVKVAQETNTRYDFVAAFTVATGTSNYDLSSQQSTAFAYVKRAWLLVLWTTQDLTIRLNSTSNPAITIAAEDSPFELRNIIEITNVYISNASGSTATVKVMLV